MTIEFIIFISIIFYALMHFFVVLKIFRSEFKNSNRKDNSIDKFLHFSIIVAAKNEESNISNLISTLKKLNYPEDNYEVIIVDDNSNDDSFHLAKKLTYGLENFTVISAINKKYEKKRGALDYGI